MEESEKIKYKAAIEAVLFSFGEAVPVRKIAQALELESNVVRGLLKEMMQEYDVAERGIKIVELEDAFQFCTKREYYDYLVKMALQPKQAVLTEVMMETLSIIAYKQPITKVEIEKIRGVKSDHAVNRLIEYNLVEELGRLDAPGKPILFGTTEEFLRSFGVDSAKNLPEISEEKLEDFKAEAEEEIKVDI